MKIAGIIAKVGICICAYGVYRKAYDLGIDYIRDDIKSITDLVGITKESIIKRKENA